MVKFDGNIVQFGFGAVGKSFYEKLRKEISFNENKYFVITMDKREFEAYINMRRDGRKFYNSRSK